MQTVIQELKISEINIPKAQKHRLIGIINKNLEAFALDDDDLGCTDLIEHPIDVGANLPFKEKRRPTPYAAREFVQTEIDRYKRLGIVSDADLGNCPYSSAIVVVPKKDGTYRLCIDYRRLNSQTTKDTYQLPLIQQIFDALAGQKYFIALDLLMGYQQILLREADRLKTAFFAENGLYQFNVMPFGLTNAPATFQRLMDKIFKDDLFRDLLAFLDDLLVFGKTLDAVLDSFDKCLGKLIKAGLKCKPKNVKYYQREWSIWVTFSQQRESLLILQKLLKFGTGLFQKIRLKCSLFWVCAIITGDWYRNMLLLQVYSIRQQV